MYKIQTLNKISSVGLKIFPLERYEIGSEFSHPDAVLVRSTSMHELELAETLKAIARAGAGVNNIPVDRCTEQGIVVFNTPGANANAVKELVVTGLLLTSRRVLDGIMWAQELKSENIHKEVESNKSLFKGPELKGKTLGVIGLGAIGIQVANTALSLGMKVQGYDPYLSVDAAWKLSTEVNKAINLDQLLSSSDYISLHIPLTEKTTDYLDRKEFSNTKTGARLLNFSRGELVNNDAVLEALEGDQLSYYVTDFPEESLIGNKKVICIPHLGASTPESEENCAVMAADQLISFLEDGNIINSINFPETVMPRNGGGRITVANRNIPRMVGSITSILADDQVNIADMLNKHKNELAYNIIDVDGGVSEETLQKIKEVEGVITVRYIS